MVVQSFEFFSGRTVSDVMFLFLFLALVPFRFHV